jgi:hypothetical protein
MDSNINKSIIWPGSSSFFPGETPFGFYDNDPYFQEDADKVAKFCAYRLGFPQVDIELQDKNFYTAFEEAVTVYGNEVYNFKIRDNYLSLEGSTTGSLLNDVVVNPHLGGVIRIASNYGSEAGVGGSITYYSGSIMLQPQRQKYDLNEWAAASASLEPGDSIEIKRVFYQGPPALMRFFDPYAGTGTGFQSLLESFGFGSFSPGINFMLMPIYFDLEKIQSIEFNDTVRKSAYSFEVINNQLKIFPIPVRQGRLFFEYVKRSERDSPINPYYSGSNFITNPSNVPYANPTYLKINSVGKQWIFQYALALSKEMLGYIRGKYSTVPIPDAEVTLNQSDLLSAATAEKTALLEQLRNMLEDTSRQKQLERKQAENEAVNNTLSKVPLPFYIG